MRTFWLPLLTCIILHTDATSTEHEILISPQNQHTDPALMTVGTRVVRGKDWSWMDQDGGAGNKGTIVKGVDHGWVTVQWDSGDNNSYRMGEEGKYDLDLAASPSFFSSTAEADTTPVTSAPNTSLSGPELAALMTVGARVVRGKDWKGGDEDGGAGGKGIIIGPGPSSNWVRVRWDTGASYNYRMGDDGRYDLSLADDYSPLKSRS